MMTSFNRPEVRALKVLRPLKLVYGIESKLWGVHMEWLMLGGASGLLSMKSTYMLEIVLHRPGKKFVEKILYM